MDHFRGRLLWFQKSHCANVAADDLMQRLHTECPYEIGNEIWEPNMANNHF